MNTKRYSKAEFIDLFLIINTGFLGWITESMVAVYFTQEKEHEIELLVFYNKEPTPFDKKILSQEILNLLKDQLSDYNIRTVEYKQIVLESTLASFKEVNKDFAKKYWPIFQKYEFASYDLED
jgi:hypothetical protein